MTSTTTTTVFKTLRVVDSSAGSDDDESRSTQLSVVNRHPRDARIVFDEEPHLYYVDGEGGNTSVTTIIHSLFPAFEAERMSRMCAAKAARENDPSYKYHGMTAEQIQTMWREKGEQASRAGTEMHLMIELYYNGVPEVVQRITGATQTETEKTASTDPGLSPELCYFRDFLRDYPHLRAHRTEWCVFDEELKLCGSIDMVFFNERTQTYNIYDWKRVADGLVDPGSSSSVTTAQTQVAGGNAGAARPPGYGIWPCSARVPDTKLGHYTLQLNIYKYMLEKHYGMCITELALVVLHPDNADYFVVPLEDWSSTVVPDVIAFRKEMLAHGGKMPLRSSVSRKELAALRTDPTLDASECSLKWPEEEEAEGAVGFKRKVVLVACIGDSLFD